MDCATGGDSALQPTFRDAALEHSEATVAEDLELSDDGEAWRLEVAARLERYRSRHKPRAPRYPSLFLPFDSPETRARPNTPSEPPAAAVQTHVNMALQIEEEPAASVADYVGLAITESSEPDDNLIEFPRSAAIPVFHAPELAEPILDRPRIIEAPEIVPPPPALGGILIEPAAPKESDRKNGPDVPVAPASIGQRLAAALVDGLILGAALTGFAAIFLRMNPERMTVPLFVGSALAVAFLLGMAYEYLFVVYTGATLGLHALKLRLVRFDGSPTTRRIRRWRVLASFLSVLSLGLGYFWSMLDENGLCWHDRITRTHIQATPST